MIVKKENATKLVLHKQERKPENGLGSVILAPG